MDKKERKIYIVGAGISGLTAAVVLERNGFHPVIIEGSDRVGGRVKTDIAEGYQLDHGFQVLLTAYPTAKEYLDLKALELQHFLPGATIFHQGKQKTIGDPLRNLSLLLPTLFSGIGSVTDKVKVLELNNRLKSTSIEEVFKAPEKTTLQYLKDLGFSGEMIDMFFRPFFGGIFLESELNTSSRMFEFVYKMFGEGFAALPKAGMEAIPKQLQAKLRHTTFHFNTKVRSVEDDQIYLEDGTILKTDHTIIATEASALVPNLNNQDNNWVSCDTLYFETSGRVIDKPLIGLIPDKDALINNICYHTSLPSRSKGDGDLLSVTVVKDHSLDQKELIVRIKKELQDHCNIKTERFLKHYPIAYALPKPHAMQYELLPSETKLKSRVFLAGDYLLNGSLNAAMISGERAALGLIENL
ncbi:NAD(P)/FAD-dependent oxidoreductase [Robertkochia sediminum]|uniref:NAD(P)/FAD-dependent oxidoreductase n=1 Tax=Robertkochia sediminum TaxID=2785326 RepID=UPI0019339378|nr:NAD(P)/FAD-dependent oxidoreductase [Robertkochia sediminum]MBL7473267.1 FAD-dependent oxidoreductase [Robertkochia sediminum]